MTNDELIEFAYRYLKKRKEDLLERNKINHNQLNLIYKNIKETLKP